MKTKLITATAFSLLMAVGAATAQTAEAPAAEAPVSGGIAGDSRGLTPTAPGTDPVITNSTGPGSDASQQDCGTADQSVMSAPVTAEGEVAVNKCDE